MRLSSLRIYAPQPRRRSWTRVSLSRRRPMAASSPRPMWKPSGRFASASKSVSPTWLCWVRSWATAIKARTSDGIIDPIDGTAEFARKLPLYGCIIGLHYKDQPLLGVIDHQALGLRCHATYGLGAFANAERLAIDDCDPGEEGVGRAHWIALTGKLLEAHGFDPGIQSHRRRIPKLPCLSYLLRAYARRHGWPGCRHGVGHAALGSCRHANPHRRGRWAATTR